MNLSKLAALQTYLKKWIIIRNPPGILERALVSLLGVAVILLLWFLLTAGVPEERIIDPITLPGVGDTLKSFPRLWFERAVARSALWSLTRVISGFTLAAAIGVPLGVLAGTFLRLNALLRPLSIFGRNIPIAALIPLTLMWFGLGETQKVMFIFFASVAFVFFDSTGAIQRVPDSHLDAAYTLGARVIWKQGAIYAALVASIYGVVFMTAHLFLSQRPGPNDAELWVSWRQHFVLQGVVGFLLGFLLWLPILSMQAISKVLFPLALPDIVNSLRLLFGLAFGYIMLAEVINAEYGLGAIINLSQRQGPREHIYLALILIALVAYGIDRTILWAQTRLFPYRRMGEQ
jgi:ABC-type nitrate/sulfonate/bicarbonate transport system permease component